MYNIYTFLEVCEAYLTNELTVDEIMGYSDSIRHIFHKFEAAATAQEFADVCEFFYTTAQTGRTNLHIVKCKTLTEYEQRFETPQVDAYAELGIKRDVKILGEQLKRPWIKTSMKRARVANDNNNSINDLF
jgi:hypothetical protein